MSSLSSRLANLPISSVRKLIPLMVQTEKQGVNIYKLNMGEPDIASPDVMLDAVKSFSTNPIRYAPSGGTKEYIAALKAYYHGLGYSFIDEKQIIGTTAGSEAINMALFATCDPGDHILTFEPFYSAYQTAAKLWNIQLNTVETKLADGFHLPSKEMIEAAITPRTKAILLANPNNPTGTVYTHEEIKMLVALTKKHNLFLISDEVYREYVFVDRPHIPILDFMLEIPDQAILVDSLSKRYSICGARLGCLVSLNPDLMQGALKFAMSRLSSGLIDQHLGASLTQVPTAYIEGIKKEFQKRRDITFEMLRNMPGVEISLPEGAFYAFVKLPIPDAARFCEWLLTDFRDDNETVMLAPGDGFYADPQKGKQYVRIAYVLEEKKLRRALELLKNALEQYKVKSI